MKAALELGRVERVQGQLLERRGLSMRLVAGEVPGLQHQKHILLWEEALLMQGEPELACLGALRPVLLLYQSPLARSWASSLRQLWLLPWQV